MRKEGGAGRKVEEGGSEGRGEGEAERWREGAEGRREGWRGGKVEGGGGRG